MDRLARRNATACRQDIQEKAKTLLPQLTEDSVVGFNSKKKLSGFILSILSILLIKLFLCLQ
jgi:hypothetical protein